MTEYMLTTTDNPYSPFTQYDEWYRLDEDKGYATCGLLARIAQHSDELSDTDQSIAIDLAIDEIVEINVLGIYEKVQASDFPRTLGD